jgi:NADH-quinone oxidoreductase subunit M
MAFVTIGIVTFNLYGIEGSLLIMLSHGFISSALFLCIGVLYDRHHTRLIKYYSGLTQVMPIYSFFFVFFSMANLGFPGTSSFAGEFLTLIGSYQSNTFVTFFASTGMILGAGYSLWLCNKVLFGNLKNIYTLKFLDLNLKEFLILFPLFFLIIIVGFNPNIILPFSHLVCLNILFEFF